MEEAYLVYYNFTPIALIKWKGVPDPKTIAVWYSNNFDFSDQLITVYPLRLPIIDSGD